MEKNLSKLLTQIQIEEIYLEHFNKGSISRIVSNKSEKRYAFYFLLENTLPVDVYQIFIEKMKLFFCEYKIEIKIEARKKKNIKQYIELFLELNKIKTSSIEVEEKKYELKIILADNELEDEVKKLKKKLKDFLSMTGFGELEVIFKAEKKPQTINATVSSETIIINEGKGRNKEPENKNIIYGQKIDGPKQIIKI